MPVDPLLIDPLNIHGAMRRRYQAKALLDALGLGHRVDRYDEDFGPLTINDSTYVLVFQMLDRLADVRATRNISIPGAAQLVVAGSPGGSKWKNAWRGDAVTAALDLGWGHITVRAEGELRELREVADSLAAVYVREMTSRVLTMLREWQKRGYMSNAA